MSCCLLHATLDFFLDITTLKCFFYYFIFGFNWISYRGILKKKPKKTTTSKLCLIPVLGNT